MGDVTEQLHVRMRRLDETALGEFSSTYGPRLQRLFLRRGLSPADADALTGNTITQVVMNIKRFRPQGTEPDNDTAGFDNWVHAIARRVWIDDWRQTKPTEPLPSTLAWPTRPAWDAPPSSAAEAVAAEVARLGEPDGAIVCLHVVEELPFKTVGERLGLSEAAARKRYERAVKWLVRVLDDDPSIRDWRATFADTSTAG